MFNLFIKYQSFRAYQKYNYPLLFILLGFGKTLCQFTLVFAIAWYGLPMLVGYNGKQKSINTVVQAPVLKDTGVTQSVTIPAVLKQVEILAVASDNEEAVVKIASVDNLNTVKAGMYNSGWLLNQNADYYVVQLASSISKTAMYNKAIELSNSYPSVVFPFKKTRANRMMYGYSIGLYGSVEQARESIEALSETTKREGVWIRQVGEIQKKIKSVQ